MNGEVIWQVSDSSFSEELHGLANKKVRPFWSTKIYSGKRTNLRTNDLSRIVFRYLLPVSRRRRRWDLKLSVGSTSEAVDRLRHPRRSMRSPENWTRVIFRFFKNGSDRRIIDSVHLVVALRWSLWEAVSWENRTLARFFCWTDSIPLRPVVVLRSIRCFGGISVRRTWIGFAEQEVCSDGRLVGRIKPVAVDVIVVVAAASDGVESVPATNTIKLFSPKLAGWYYKAIFLCIFWGVSQQSMQFSGRRYFVVVVIGGDTWSRGRKFESQHWALTP